MEQTACFPAIASSEDTLPRPVYGTAFAAQALALFARAGLTVLQVMLLRFTAFPAVTGRFPFPTAIVESTLQAAAVGLCLLLDWLLLSPFYLGKAALFFDLAAGNRTGLSACFDAYRPRRWRLSLRWRLSFGTLKGAVALLLFGPFFWLAESQVLLSATPIGGLSPLLLCRLSMLLWLTAGGILWCLWRLRYAAIGLFLPECGRIFSSLAASRRLVRRHREALWRQCLHRAILFLPCLLIIPAIFCLPLFWLPLYRHLYRFNRYDRQNQLQKNLL